MILINLFSSHLPAKCVGFAIPSISDSSIYTHTSIMGKSRMAFIADILNCQVFGYGTGDLQANQIQRDLK